MGYGKHGVLSWEITVETINRQGNITEYTFDCYDRRMGSNFFNINCAKFLSQILSVVGVMNWEDLIGECVRIETTENSRNIDRIGNILRNEWFDLKDYGCK